MAKPLIVQYTNNCKYYVCPYCGRRFLYSENWREFRYCYACGGALKWFLS